MKRAFGASLPLLAVAGAAAAAGWPYGFVALAAEALRASDDERAVILLEEGDRPLGGGGLAVAGLGIPVTNDRGVVAFTGYLDDAGALDGFVWRDGRVVFRNSEAGLIGASPAMGLGGAGQFVYQSSLDDRDVIWSQQGLIVHAGDPAPGFPAGTVLELSRRPSMLEDRSAYWVSEFRDGPGGKGKGRVLYRSPGPDPAQIEIVLRSDDIVAGFPLSRPRGLDFNYDLSEDGAHLIQVVELVTGSTTDDGAVYLDGALAAREGATTGDGDRWTRFLQVAVNGRGDSLFSAETDGDIETDVVLAFNGEPALREGMALPGEARLLPQANVLALAVDDLGRAVHLWSVGGFGAELLLFACDAAHLESSVALVRTPQRLEIDEEQGPDVTLVRFSDVGHGPALSLDGGNRVWVEAELGSLDGPATDGRREAIVGLRLPACPAPAS